MLPITDNPTVTCPSWKWKLRQLQREIALLAAGTTADVLRKYPGFP